MPIGPMVPGLRCRALTTAFSVGAVRRKESGQPHSAVQQSWPAQYVWVNEGPPCGGAAAEVPDQGEKGMGDSVGQSPPQTPIWFIPPTPRGDNRPGGGVPARPSVPRIRALNIIPSELCNSRRHRQYPAPAESNINGSEARRNGLQGV